MYNLFCGTIWLFMFELNTELAGVGAGDPRGHVKFDPMRMHTAPFITRYLVAGDSIPTPILQL